MVACYLRHLKTAILCNKKHPEQSAVVLSSTFGWWKNLHIKKMFHYFQPKKKSLLQPSHGISSYRMYIQIRDIAMQVVALWRTLIIVNSAWWVLTSDRLLSELELRWNRQHPGLSQSQTDKHPTAFSDCPEIKLEKFGNKYRNK